MQSPVLVTKDGQQVKAPIPYQDPRIAARPSEEEMCAIHRRRRSIKNMYNTGPPCHRWICLNLGRHTCWDDRRPPNQMPTPIRTEPDPLEYPHLFWSDEDMPAVLKALSQQSASRSRYPAQAASDVRCGAPRTVIPLIPQKKWPFPLPNESIRPKQEANFSEVMSADQLGDATIHEFVEHTLQLSLIHISEPTRPY